MDPTKHKTSINYVETLEQPDDPFETPEFFKDTLHIPDPIGQVDPYLQQEPSTEQSDTKVLDSEASEPRRSQPAYAQPQQLIPSLGSSTKLSKHCCPQHSHCLP